MSQTLTPSQLTEIRRIKAMIAWAGSYTNGSCFIGPTGPYGPPGIVPGPTGPLGPTGPTAPTTTMLSFTIYIQYLNGNTFQQLYIPPGLFASSTSLASGGTFTANDPAGNLIFLATNPPSIQSITMLNLAFPQVASIALSGYVAGTSPPGWQPTSFVRISNTNIYYNEPADYSLTVNNLNLSYINGGDLTPAPSGVLAGYNATLTLNFLPTTPNLAAIYGAPISFTIYLQYSPSTQNINGIYIPPGLFKQSTGLAAGGLFNANQGTNLIFNGTNSVILANTSYPQLATFLISGYNASSSWVPMTGSYYGGIYVSYNVPSDNNLTISNLILTYINGGYLSPPSSGVLSSYLVTISLYYIPY